MIWNIFGGIFDTFTMVRMCAQHHSRMSRVGGDFYVYSFLHFSRHSEVYFFLDFLGWKN